MVQWRPFKMFVYKSYNSNNIYRDFDSHSQLYIYIKSLILIQNCVSSKLANRITKCGLHYTDRRIKGLLVYIVFKFGLKPNTFELWFYIKVYVSSILFIMS